MQPTDNQDERKPIPMPLPKHVVNVCRIGQGAKCCKYLVMGSSGFECMKIDKRNKLIIEQQWGATQHVAQGDNCGGIDIYLLNT